MLAKMNTTQVDYELIIGPLLQSVEQDGIQSKSAEQNLDALTQEYLESLFDLFFATTVVIKQQISKRKIENGAQSGNR